MTHTTIFRRIWNWILWMTEPEPMNERQYWKWYEMKNGDDYE